MAAGDAGGPLAARTGRPRPCVVEPDPIARRRPGARAIRERGHGPIVVAGSLYLVGAARGHLVDDPDLRDPSPSEDA